MENKSVLIVEDDVEINELLHIILEQAGIHTTQAYAGTEALLLLQNNTYDLMLLDLMLPGVCGENLINQVKNETAMPIIVISAKIDIDHKVQVLKMGADDYITKPFHQSEVMARVEVQLRKSRIKDPNQTWKTWHELHMDIEELTVYLAEQPLPLTNAEFSILSLFIDNPKHVFSKREIYENIWTGPYVGDDNTVSMHVSNLRKKIAMVTTRSYIKTVWGIGFMLI